MAALGLAAVRRLSLAVASGVYSLSRCADFTLRWLLLLWSTGFRHVGFSSCGSRGLVAPWHVGSSRTRARTRVPCIGRRILNHCATREAQIVRFKQGNCTVCNYISKAPQRHKCHPSLQNVKGKVQQGGAPTQVRAHEGGAPGRG